MKRNGFSLVELLIVIAIVLILVTIAAANLRGGWTPDSSKAVEVVQALGMTDARVTDTYTWSASLNGCGEDDSVAFKVVAKNAQEKEVHLTVCCGGFGNAKGCTPRF